MPLQPGTTLGPYQVTAKIGEGGMGEVYRARDTKLDRDVALKVLPQAFTDDPDRLARFEREAKVLASLNHPNIGSIYGLEEADGQKALVLELVEGPTLAERIKQGPIPVDEALPIAKQIAEALEAAHEQGIIHRDLKPANVKVKDDGTVKVLDFGLAKAFQPDASDPNMSQSPTISLTAAATQMGMVIGTAAYMSPEQAKGKVVDKRADVWAFGAVLFEMLTGQRTFAGKDVSDTLAYVLTKEIDWKPVPADVPAPIRHLLRRCLERDPRQRLRDIGEARIGIEGAGTVPVVVAAEVAPVSQLRVWQALPLAVGAIALVVVTGLAVWALLGGSRQPSPSPTRFAVTLPDSDLLPSGLGDLLALSPDGQTLVYGATRNGDPQLFRRPIAEFAATPMPNAEILGMSTPFFSPDGQWLGFVANGALQKVALAGGPAQTLTTGVIRRGASWTADDMIIYGATGPLMQIPGTGGEPTPLFTPDDRRQSWYPQILRGGEAVLFTLTEQARDAGELHLLFPESGEHRTLLSDAAAGRVLESGHLVFVRSGTLWAAPFDQDRLDIAGTPVPVVEDVRVESGGAVQYVVSDDGTLVYLPGGVNVVGESTLVLADWQGTTNEVPLPADSYFWPRFSPDGTRIAVQVGGINNANIFIYEMSSNRFRQLTFGGGEAPIWTPDGIHVTFLADDVLWNVAADFSEEPRPLSTAIAEVVFGQPHSWSPDGRVLFWGEVDGVAQLTFLEGGEVEHDPLLSRIARGDVNFSGDGKWFSYSTNETGAAEVFVQPYPLGSGQRRRLTQGGGDDPVWSRSGRELFYANDGRLWAVEIETDPTLTWQDPVELFETPWPTAIGPRVNYDVTPDGERFVFVQPQGDESGEFRQINVVLNWFEELTERVPLP